jgi:hypothetical protein
MNWHTVGSQELSPALLHTFPSAGRAYVVAQSTAMSSHGAHCISVASCAGVMASVAIIAMAGRGARRTALLEVPRTLQHVSCGGSSAISDCLSRAIWSNTNTVLRSVQLFRTAIRNSDPGREPKGRSRGNDRRVLLDDSQAPEHFFVPFETRRLVFYNNTGRGTAVRERWALGQQQGRSDQRSHQSEEAGRR